jgi:hypothetical protein
MPAFDPETLQLLRSTAEVDIETARGRRTIWIVVDGGNAYIRSVRGASGAWYRSVHRDPQARLHVDSRTLPIRVSPVSDAAEIQRVSSAIDEKYRSRWPGPTDAMLRSEVLPTTLRVDPA